MRKNPMIKALAMVLTLVMVCTTVLAVPTSAEAAVKAKKITLSAKKQTVYIGKSVTLKVKKVTPAKASKAVKFTSSDSTVATVNGKGKVTGKKVGTATITVTSKSNAKAKATCKITVKQQVKKIHTATQLIMQKGKSATLKYGVTPANAANKKMTFATSNKKVATVDKKGKIKAKKPGNAKITVKSADGCAKATVKVSVKAKITPVKSVTLDQTALSLNPGAAATLKATLTPAKPTSKKVYWVSSDTSVATVSTKGVVTAVADGTAKISVYATDNSGKSASCTVTVTTPVPPTPEQPKPEQPKPVVPTPPATVAVQSVSVNPTEVTLNVGETQKAIATVAPANATNKNITWSTSNAEVATVANDGTITAVAAGTADVIATSHNGKKATVKVTVEAEEGIIVRADGITTITLADDKDYVVSYVFGDKSVEKTVTAEQIAKAYEKYQEVLVKVTSVEQVWDKATQEVADKLADKLVAEYGKTVEVTVTTNGNTKTVTATYGDYTATAVVTLADDTITIAVSNDKIVGGTKTVVISDIELEAGTATIGVDNYVVEAAWNATSATIAKGEAMISVEYVDGKYVATIDDGFASEVYNQVKDAVVSTDKVPANYEAAIEGLTIVEAE